MKKNSLDPEEELPHRLRSGDKSEERSREASPRRPSRSSERKEKEEAKEKEKGKGAKVAQPRRKAKKNKIIKKAKKKSSKAARKEAEEEGQSQSLPRINVIPPGKAPAQPESHTSEEISLSNHEKSESEKNVVMEEEKPLEQKAKEQDHSDLE